MRLLRTQKGFTGIEVALVLLAIAAIGGGGYYAYHARMTHQAQTKTTAPKQASSPSISDSSARSFVQSFYNSYIKASGSTRQELALVQTNGTSSFVSAYKSANDYDPVLCAQNTVPSFTIDSVKLPSTTQATVSIQRAGYETEGDEVLHIIQPSSGPLKINSIGCPMPASTSSPTSAAAPAVPAASQDNQIIAAVRAYNFGDLDPSLIPMTVASVQGNTATVDMDSDSDDIHNVITLTLVNGQWQVTNVAQNG
jgi:Tfp pilus assembly protein PilV